MQTKPAPCTIRKLAEENQPLVQSIAANICRKLPRHLELNDLVAYGQVGLTQAAADFDPGRGVRFTTFAYYRIRGAIYDGVSQMTWFSRADYRRHRCSQRDDESIVVGAERVERLDGKKKDELLAAQSRPVAVVPLASDREESCVPDPSTPSPVEAVMTDELRKELPKLIDALPSKLGQLIRTTYFEGLSLQDAGERLGISRSWACRLHARALKHLERQLQTLGYVSV